MRRRLFHAVLLMLGCSLAGFSLVLGAAPCRCGCPQCGEPCVPKVEQVQEKKHCWKVECETICIPAIRLPWAWCEEPLKCGRTKTVRKLKKVEYECPSCKYTWSAQSACDCAGEKPGPATSTSATVPRYEHTDAGSPVIQIRD